MKAPKMPKGVREGDDKLRISVVLDKQVFDDICSYGTRQGWTFSQTVNDTAKCGLIDIKDAEQFEPELLRRCA